MARALPRASGLRRGLLVVAIASLIEYDSVRARPTAASTRAMPGFSRAAGQSFNFVAASARRRANRQRARVIACGR